MKLRLESTRGKIPPPLGFELCPYRTVSQEVTNELYPITSHHIVSYFCKDEMYNIIDLHEVIILHNYEGSKKFVYNSSEWVKQYFTGQKIEYVPNFKQPSLT